MTDILKQALEDIEDLYDDAVENPYIYKPLAYSLYMTWKKYNFAEKERNIHDVKTSIN